MSIPADVLRVAVKLIDALIDLVGEGNVNVLQSMLTDQAAKRQMAAANAAKAAKFGPKS